jgi:hypothetical protein
MPRLRDEPGDRPWVICFQPIAEHYIALQSGANWERGALEPRQHVGGEPKCARTYSGQDRSHRERNNVTGG